MDVWGDIAAERIALCDDLEGLTTAQWSTPSLCGAWQVRDVLAHLVLPHTPYVGARFAVAFVQARGSFDRANEIATAKYRTHTPESLVADLRRYADGRFRPPGFGPVAPLTDVLVHSADIRIPLGIPDARPGAVWASVLDFAFTKQARRGFAPHPPPALRYEATDIDWAQGDGPGVQGPAAALGLALFGRSARLSELGGPGAEILETWLRR